MKDRGFRENGWRTAGRQVGRGLAEYTSTWRQPNTFLVG